MKDITGNAYEYGMMVMDPRDTEEEPITGWKLENRTPIEFADSVGYSGRSGDMVGVVKGKKQGDKDTISAIIKLTEVKNVKQSDFFESQGVPHITVNGRTYRIAEDVECCYNLSANRRNAEWMQDGDGAQRLSAIRAPWVSRSGSSPPTEQNKIRPRPGPDFFTHSIQNLQGKLTASSA